MNENANNTAELRRLGELCVLMEGLFHVLGTRDDSNAVRLIQKYCCEFNSLCATVFAGDTAVASQSRDIPEISNTEKDIAGPGTDEFTDRAIQPEKPADEQPEPEAPSLSASTVTAEAEVCQEPVCDREQQSVPAIGDSPARPGELRVDEMLTRREARELRNAFTLNDKFRFRRELFENDNDRFREALRMIEAMSDYDEALTYMRDDLGWDMDADAAQDFAAIVANHFAAV